MPETLNTLTSDGKTLLRLVWKRYLKVFENSLNYFPPKLWRPWSNHWTKTVFLTGYSCCHY